MSADVDTVLAAFERLDPDMPWTAVRHQVLPMFPRVRPLPWHVDNLVRTIVPPGLLVGFGIDIGPALTFVTQDLLDRWAVDLTMLTSVALENVRRLADRCDPGAVVRDTIDGVPLAAFQSRVGIASLLLLVPDVLPQIIGPGPHLLLAPMRDVLLALPANADRELASWLAAEWEALDPNCLHLGAFHFDGVSITPVPLDDAVAQA